MTIGKPIPLKLGKKSAAPEPCGAFFMEKIRPKLPTQENYRMPASGAGASGASRVYGYKISKKSLHDDLQALNSGQYVVLLALRLFGDKEGHCWPTMRQLGELSGLDKATIQRNIKALSKKGFIKIEIKKGRGGKRFEYQLLK